MGGETSEIDGIVSTLDENYEKFRIGKSLCWLPEANITLYVNLDLHLKKKGGEQNL